MHAETLETLSNEINVSIELAYFINSINSIVELFVIILTYLFENKTYSNVSCIRPLLKCSWITDIICVFSSNNFCIVSELDTLVAGAERCANTSDMFKSCWLSYMHKNKNYEKNIDERLIDSATTVVR